MSCFPEGGGADTIDYAIDGDGSTANIDRRIDYHTLSPGQKTTTAQGAVL